MDSDVKKPLAAVSAMNDEGNTVVFSKKYGNYIENDVSGQRMSMEMKKGVFVVKANVLENGAEAERDIVIDPGAADNVMPKDILQGLPLLEKEAGVRFAGANGSELVNYGRRMVSFVPVEWGF